MEGTRDQVKALIERGLTVREISLTLGVTTQAIYKHLKALGIEPPSRRTEERQAS